jgi:TorA maturation chaperone TorD
VYVTKKRILFQESTLEVREAYRKEGFLPGGYPRVSDDHISLELDFMNLLAEECRNRCELEDLPEYHRLLEVQLEFLTKHLLKWVPNYVSDLDKAAPESLYSTLAHLIVAFVRFDRQTLVELMELVPPAH